MNIFRHLREILFSVDLVVVSIFNVIAYVLIKILRIDKLFSLTGLPVFERSSSDGSDSMADFTLPFDLKALSAQPELLVDSIKKLMLPILNRFLLQLELGAATLNQINAQQSEFPGNRSPIDSTNDGKNEAVAALAYSFYFLKTGSSVELTYWDVFSLSAAKCPQNPCFSQNVQIAEKQVESRSLTYSAVELLARHLGAAIMRCNMAEQRHYEDESYPQAQSLRCLGVMAPTSAEWQIFQLAAVAYGITVVPLNETLGTQALITAFNETEMNGAVVEIELWESCLQALVPSLPTLQNVVLLRQGDCFFNETEKNADFEEKFKAARSKFPEIKFYTFQDLRRIGEQQPMQPVKVSPDAVPVMYYTSGTTAIPKAVIMTHRGLIIGATSYLSRFSVFPISFEDVSDT